MFVLGIHECFGKCRGKFNRNGINMQQISWTNINTNAFRMKLGVGKIWISSKVEKSLDQNSKRQWQTRI